MNNRKRNFKTRYYYLMFGLLYFVQGSALAYFRNFQKPYLDSLGIDPGSIGLLTSILLLPFILKILIGMLSDKVSLFRLGHRKPYIFSGLIIGAIAFLLASRVLPDQNFLLFSFLIVMGSFSVALFDSSTDGFAIEITPEDKYGRVQGIMISGRAVGFIGLSLLFGYFVQRSSYSIIFIIVGLLMLIPIVFTVFAEEPDRSKQDQQFDWKAFSLILKPVFLVFALYSIFYSIVSFGVDGLITFYMSNRLDASEISIGQFGALRGTGAVLGAVIAGLLMDRVGYKKMALATVFVISAAAALVSFSSTVPAILKIALIWGFAWGLQETVFLCLAMSLADVRIAASIFAIMMAISNIGTALVEGVATALSVRVGFQLVFLVLAAFNFINIALVILYFRLWKPKAK